MKPDTIYINLPVTNLPQAVSFYEKALENTILPAFYAEKLPIRHLFLQDEFHPEVRRYGFAWNDKKWHRLRVEVAP